MLESVSLDTVASFLAVVIAVAALGFQIWWSHRQVACQTARDTTRRVLLMRSVNDHRAELKAYFATSTDGLRLRVVHEEKRRLPARRVRAILSSPSTGASLVHTEELFPCGDGKTGPLLREPVSVQPEPARVQLAWSCGEGDVECHYQREFVFTEERSRGNTNAPLQPFVPELPPVEWLLPDDTDTRT